MGIQINGQTDTVTSTTAGGKVTVTPASFPSVDNLNATGIVTASSFRGNVTGNVNATGVSTFSDIIITGGTISGVSTAGITTAYIGSINDGSISGARNRIINGDMRLDQRNAGASVTPSDGQYTLDRYQSWLSQSSKFSVQRSATVPVGFTSSILITSLSALSVGVNDEHGITQKIEGNNISDLNWGTSDAKPVTLSFWVRSSITGNFGGMVGNGTLTRIYPFTYTINATNTWEYKTISIAGETSGTWTKDETWGMAVHFQFGVGSNRSASAGAWVNGNTSIRGVTGQTNLLATNGATWNMTGLQLEPGTVPTPFERRSYGQELALAQRYYEKSYNQDTVPGTSVTGTYAGLHITATVNTTTSVYIGGTIVFRQPKRTASSVSYWDAAGNASKFSTLTGGGLVLSNNVSALQSVYSCDNQMGFTVLPGISNMAMFGWAVSTEL